MNPIHEKLVTTFYEALAKSDVELFLSVQTDDVVYNMSGHTPISGRVVGKKVLMEDVLSLVFPGLQMDTMKFATKWKILCADDRRVVCIMEADGLGINGKRRDDKISGMWEFFDTALANDVLFNAAAPGTNSKNIAPFSF
jgi:uncharacterized protein